MSAYFWSSIIPGCANYGIKYLPVTTKRTTQWQLISLEESYMLPMGPSDSVKKAKQLVNEAHNSLPREKFVCNKKDVWDAIPETEHASVEKDVDLNYSEVPMQSVLRVKWNIQIDASSFNVTINEKAATR